MQFTQIEVIQKESPNKIIYLRRFTIDSSGDPSVTFTDVWLHSWLTISPREVSELVAYFERSGLFLPIYFSWSISNFIVSWDVPRFSRVNHAQELPVGVSIVVGGDRWEKILAYQDAPKTVLMPALMPPSIMSEHIERNQMLISSLAKRLGLNPSLAARTPKLGKST